MKLDINAPELFTATKLLYEATVTKPVETTGIIETCTFCGYFYNEGTRKRVSDNFSNMNLFRHKEEPDNMCPACILAIDSLRVLNHTLLITRDKVQAFRLENDPIARQKQVVIGDEKIKVETVANEYLMELLLDPPKEHWILLRKPPERNIQHTILKAKVNYGKTSRMWVSEGLETYQIPRDGLSELFPALIKAKEVGSNYIPFIFTDRKPHSKSPVYPMWKEIDGVIKKHRDKHYFDFIYRRILPRAEYLRSLAEKNKKTKGND